MDFIEPCFGIGHNLSLICQMTSEDIKHQLIIIISVPLPIPGRQQSHTATAKQTTVSQCHCQADNSVTVPLPSRQQCYTATAMQTTSHCHGQADNSVTVPLPSRQQCHSATANSVTAKLTTVSQCHCQADNSCLCPTLLLVSEPLFSYGVKMTKPETFALHQDNCECPMHLALICGTELESHAAFPQLSQSLQDTKQAQFVSVFISLLRWRTLVI